MATRFLVDAHLDLSMNAMEWNRDLRWSLEDLRQSEKGLTDKPDRERGTVCFPEMHKGNVGLCVATLIARYVKKSNPLPGWHSPEQAYAQTQGQLAWYRAMEEAGEMVAITNTLQLENHLKAWKTGTSPIGYVLSLEGADSIRSPQYLEQAWAQGLRAIGPGHYGPGTYAKGTASTGGLGPLGPELLRQMDRLGFILDVTHLSDESFWEALDLFQGPIWASHSNCRVLVPDQRQFSDEQIKVLLQREAVIGVALDAWMLVPGWVRGHSTPQQTGVSLQTVADHLDHYCQLAGNCLSVGIGSDLDGAFGTEQSPADLNSIADLQKLEGILKARGYSDTDIDLIFHGNWLRFLQQALPKA